MTEFIFDKMTPELRAFLDHQAGYRKQADSTYPAFRAAEKPWEEAGRPKEGPLYDGAQKAREAHYGALKAHREEGIRLMSLIQPGLLDNYHAEKKAWMCRDETTTCTSEETSPDGKYKVVITSHSTGPGTWAYTKGRFFTQEGEFIAEVLRNYSAFNLLWITDHPDGHSYALSGEDYQGFTLVQLDTGEKANYLPEAAEEGFGWCWIGGEPSPDKKLLALSGCYWAAPYEIVIFDFSEPMSLPWRQLHRESDYDEFIGWTGDSSCEIGRTVVYVNAPGHRLHGKVFDEMSEAEIEEIEALAKERGVDEDDLYEEKRNVLRIWERPSDIQIARKYIEEVVGWRMDHKDPSYRFVLPDWRREVAVHLAALPEIDRLLLMGGPRISKILEWMETAPTDSP